MKVVKTYTATIAVGFRVCGEASKSSPELLGNFSGRLEVAANVCRHYCDGVGLCVTVTPTAYIYTGGAETGCLVGLINYPRFPSEPGEIRRHALILARRLLVALKQMKVSVILPDETITLESPEDIAHEA